MVCNYCGKEFSEGIHGTVSIELEEEKICLRCSIRCFTLSCKRVKKVMREMYPPQKRGIKKTKGKSK
ncbi:hypothetical protein AGMMS50268_37120 [Spirochaetia bacterium]|nr:hypothetical protein AGMMS50268_37120 [Spirochaetia bacterium]